MACSVKGGGGGGGGHRGPCIVWPGFEGSHEQQAALWFRACACLREYQRQVDSDITVGLWQGCASKVILGQCYHGQQCPVSPCDNLHPLDQQAEGTTDFHMVCKEWPKILVVTIT